MMLPLEEDSRPPYLQAADVLRTGIVVGEYAPGSRLPSARWLQERFGVSSSTVQNALRVLKQEGLVYSVLGRGSYVRSTAPNPSTAGCAGHPGSVSEETEAEHDPRPPYVRTADILRQAILSDEFGPEGRLPSARELQDRYKIANSTAQNAVRVLKREGLVFAVKGKGVFVRRTVREEHSSGTRQLPTRQGTAPAPGRTGGPGDHDAAAKLAAAEQRLARAADAYRAAAAELEIISREARSRGLLPPATERVAATASSSMA
ncbi:GntR family transcriptional regulator [Streptomyces sp. IBSNAI002]|uniref:GntR family transcriptional regulator n=1 Tax=Streptomyces sp. IBSNAI002 TaxID=3457500 RepID=UPI003FD128E8